MNKTELVAAMAKETNLSKKDIEAVLKSFTDVVASELTKGGNPQTGETMKIAASKAPKFKAGKALKDMVNE